MAFIGKASDVPKPTGKAHFRQGQFSDHLIVGQAGIMPSSAHSGVEEPYRPHVHPRAQARRTTLTMGGEERPSAKRHINPHFTSLSDDAKRAEGRLGKASVVVTDQQQRCQAFYAAGGQKSIVKQPPGQEANLCLTSYNYTPMEEQGGTATHARSNDAFTTSVQYSEARLRKIQKMHPEHRDVAAAALREYHGEPAIVPREEKISRQIAVEAFAKGSDERMAAIAATNKYAKCGYGLGESAEWLKRTVPYALDNSAPRPDTATGSRAHVHPDNNRSHFIIGATMEEMHTDPNNNPVAAPAPRLQPPAARTHFNVNAGQDYPPPPQVGVSTSLWKRPALVHYDAKHHNAHSFGEDDADSMAMKRARGGAQMRSASYRHEPPLNLFSGPPQPQTARGGPTTLRAQCEGRWRRQEDVAMERRTGRARTPQSYKKTALW